LIERYFASGLPDGQLSYLGYGTKVGKIVANVLGAGITTAIFPAMARAYSRQGERGLVDRTEYGMRLTVAVSLPALAILSAVSVPLIIVLFERGAFDRATTLSVSQVIPMMIMGEVVFFMLGNVITRTFYATKNTHTVPIIMTITSILFIFLAAWLTSIGGYVGLAWTKPITSVLGIVLLVFLMVWRLPYFQVGWLLRTLLFYGLVSLATFTLTREVAALLAAAPAIVQLLAASTIGSVFYLGLLFFVDREITVSILETTGIRTISARLGLLRLVQRLAPGGIANQR
jgi:peptidoglycan biosynthesis protein MviN/MurJ (putative lipid II flippase)